LLGPPQDPFPPSRWQPAKRLLVNNCDSSGVRGAPVDLNLMLKTGFRGRPRRLGGCQLGATQQNPKPHENPPFSFTFYVPNLARDSWQPGHQEITKSNRFRTPPGHFCFHLAPDFQAPTNPPHCTSQRPARPPKSLNFSGLETSQPRGPNQGYFWRISPLEAWRQTHTWGNFNS
jgi:hypothetical protein